MQQNPLKKPPAEMNSTTAASAVFVAKEHDLHSLPRGGQQLCTREYFLALELAGFELRKCLFEPANGLCEKLMRRAFNRPYHYFVPTDLARRTLDECASADARLVFLNTVDLAPLAKLLKRQRPNLQTVLLSHGLDSVDYLHEMRSQHWRSDFSGLRAAQVSWLGQQLVEECRHRQYIDFVLCMSTFEAEIERWLGARNVLVVPRTVAQEPLNWSPVTGRIGFVGRLDHPPNLEGLRIILDELQVIRPEGLALRCVGLPGNVGHKLTERYGFLQYLGELQEDALRDEAQTWTCTMNPIFCYARGASTKLAAMLKWGIPVLSTPEGLRGYEWSETFPLTFSSSREFSQALVRLAFDHQERRKAVSDQESALRSAVTLDQVSQRIRSFFRLTVT